MFLAFLAVHVLGARWVYSYVPYDDWSETLTGVRIGRHFGFARNHYDRIGHFAQAIIELTHRAANTTEVETQHRKARTREARIHAIDDLVIHGAAVERVRVQHHRDGGLLIRIMVVAAFDTALRALENNLRH